MKPLSIAVAMALAVVACGGTAASAPPSSVGVTSSPATTEAALSATTEPSATVAPSTTEPEVVRAAGPPAPDFELELSDGSAFVLSQQQKPIYLVFWAEW